MKNTLGAIFLVGAVLAAPFAIAVSVVASGGGGATVAHAAEEDQPYAYSANLWAPDWRARPGRPL